MRKCVLNKAKTFSVASCIQCVVVLCMKSLQKRTIYILSPKGRLSLQIRRRCFKGRYGFIAFNALLPHVLSWSNRRWCLNCTRGISLFTLLINARDKSNSYKFEVLCNFQRFCLIIDNYDFCYSVLRNEYNLAQFIFMCTLITSELSFLICLHTQLLDSINRKISSTYVIAILHIDRYE